MYETENRRKTGRVSCISYRSGTALLEPVPPPTLIDPESDDPYERRRELARRVVAAFEEDEGSLPYGVAILWRRRRNSEAVAA